MFADDVERVGVMKIVELAVFFPQAERRAVLLLHEERRGHGRRLGGCNFGSKLSP
jgi:hypothetical protein